MIYALFSICIVGATIANAAPARPADFSQQEKPVTLKVLLEQNASSVMIETKGKYAIFNPENGALVASGLKGKRAKLFAQEYGIKWGELFPSFSRLRFVPADSSGYILVNGVQYKGCIEAYSNHQMITVINEIDVDHYLKSTLGEQFPNPLPEEAMNAVAIVARTELYHMVSKNKPALWHTDAKTAHYTGTALAWHKPHIDKAIAATRHAVLTFQGAPFSATWTKNSAGKTADIASVFRKAISTPAGVSAPIAAKDRLSNRWSFTASKKALAQTANLQSITSLDLYLVPGAEKVYAIKLSDSQKSNDIDFFTLQKILGPNKLKSNDFSVAIQGDQLVFTGYGEGPGVGLCLYSAETMAKKGSDAAAILAAFFPDTKLEKIDLASVQ